MPPLAGRRARTAPAAQRRGRRALAVLVLIYLLALLGSFYLGLVWRDYAIPFLWDRGYRALAVVLPGTVGAIALLVMR